MHWDSELDPNSSAFKLAVSNSSVIRSVAGPGSGKTLGLKRRIAKYIEEGNDPRRILAITFTRTAAHDLAKEISLLNIEGVDKITARTMHSYALSILMKADVLDQTKRIPRMVIEHEIKPALKDINDPRFGDAANKEKLLNEFLAAWAKMQHDEPGFIQKEIDKRFKSSIIEWLGFHEGILVGEVIPIVIEYLKNNPASPEINKYSMILVDEYQDLNRSEQEFIKLIRGNANLVIVGDDDQSIYSFKYAHPEGIRELTNLYGDYEDISFEICRRCPKIVTWMASSLININQNRTLGELVPLDSNPEGEVSIIQWPNYNDELEGISNIIKNELDSGRITPGDILVLTPRRKIGYKLRDLLLSMGVSTKTYFRESAIKREKVKRAYSLINLLLNPEDKISLRYLLGCHSPNFRNTQYLKLMEYAKANNLAIRSVLDKILSSEITIKGISTILDEYRKILVDLSKILPFIKSNSEESIFNLFVENEDDETDFYELNQIFLSSIESLGNLNVDDDMILLNQLREIFLSLKEKISLPDSPDDINHVRIMTLHASKGLSAKFVILCSMIDQLMPYIPDNYDRSQLPNILEEQRRLFYVAITRCKTDPSTYPGKLIVSSFVSIYGLDAVRLGIQCNPKRNLNVSFSRYIRELGPKAPRPQRGY